MKYAIVAAAVLLADAYCTVHGHKANAGFYTLIFVVCCFGVIFT